MKKSNLDERQEMALLKIEHNGCWLAFWGLAAVLALQFIVYGYDNKALFGEWAIFMILSIYLSAACEKHGIWDRHLKANARTNLLCSIVAGVVFGLIFFLYTYRNFPDKIVGSIASGVFSGTMLFVIVFAVLQLATRSYKKRLAQMEEEPEESDEIEE